jgi:signal transduction histidine kinase
MGVAEAALCGALPQPRGQPAFDERILTTRATGGVMIRARLRVRAGAARFLRSCLRHPLIVMTTASVVVTVLLVGAGILWLHALAIANAGRELTNLSIVITELTETTMQSADFALRDAQAQLRLVDPTVPDAQFRLHQLFQDVVRNSPELRTISIFDAKGNMLVISREFPAIEHNIADRDYFRQQRDHAVPGQYYIGYPARSETTGKRTISISQAIRSSGAFKGIIRIGMETAYFENLFGRIEIGQGSAITLIRDDGILLLRSPSRPGSIGRDISETPAFRQFRAEGSRMAWHKSPVDGTWRFVVSRKLKDAPLIVAVSLAQDAVLGPWRKQTALVMGIGATALLILLTLCTIAARQLRRREEGMQRAMDQAVAANQAKSHFLANMSHELRTPINAILGFSEMIGMRLLGPDIGDAYLERVGLIRTSAQLLIKLVNDLLDLEKIDSGHSKLVLEPFNVSELIDSCFTMIASEAARKHLRLSKYPPKAAAEFIGDRRVVQQVLLNLIGNAVKYVDEGDAISVAWEIQGEELRISVKDSGPGIPDGVMKNIFEPFQTADSEIRRPNSGGGLGLSICRKLVQLHGGAIEIASGPSTGTTVDIHIRSGVSMRESGAA